MELELRYTLESFEGQLSAMAREKVAIQKQVKELTGQCTTLRKQVGRIVAYVIRPPKYTMRMLTHITRSCVVTYLKILQVSRRFAVK